MVRDYLLLARAMLALTSSMFISHLLLQIVLCCSITTVAPTPVQGALQLKCMHCFDTFTLLTTATQLPAEILAAILSWQVKANCIPLLQTPGHS